MSATAIATTPEIDFLPAHFREKTAKRKGRAGRLSLIILLAMMLPVASFYQLRVRSRLQKQLSDIQPQCAAVDALRNQLQELDKKRQRLEANARLIAYLDHPWPRSQVLAALLPAMPDSISLTSIQLETMADNAAAVAVAPNNFHQENKPQAADLPPAEADLRKLREQCDKSQLVVLLTGLTRDPSALHEYLGAMGRDRLFVKTELISLESPSTKQVRPGADAEGSQFRARLVVSHSPGQPNGPMGGEKPAEPVPPRTAATGRLP